MFKHPVAVLRYRANLEKKSEESGEWCHGVGLHSSDLNDLLDVLEAAKSFVETGYAMSDEDSTLIAAIDKFDFREETLAEYGIDLED